MNREAKKALYTQQPKIREKQYGNTALQDASFDMVWISGKGLYLVADYLGKKYYIKFSEEP